MFSSFLLPKVKCSFGLSVSKFATRESRCSYFSFVSLTCSFSSFCLIAFFSIRFLFSSSFSGPTQSFLQEEHLPSPQRLLVSEIWIWIWIWIWCPNFYSIKAETWIWISCWEQKIRSNVFFFFFRLRMVQTHVRNTILGKMEKFTKNLEFSTC